MTLFPNMSVKNLGSTKPKIALYAKLKSVIVKFRDSASDFTLDSFQDPSISQKFLQGFDKTT